MVDRHEVTEAHGQATGFNRDVIFLSVTRRNDHLFMRLALGFRQQGDKRLLQGLTAGLRFKFCGTTGRQYFPAFIATSQSKRSASSI